MDTRYQVRLLWKRFQVEFGTLLGTPPDYKEKLHFDLYFNLEGQLSQPAGQVRVTDVRYGH